MLFMSLFIELPFHSTNMYRVLTQASPMAHQKRICLSVQEIWVQSLSQKDPLEKEMANHSSVLAWDIPQTEESDRKMCFRQGKALVQATQRGLAGELLCFKCHQLWSLIDTQLVDGLVCRVKMVSLICLALWQEWIKKLGITETINKHLGLASPGSWTSHIVSQSSLVQRWRCGGEILRDRKWKRMFS